jgi:hypothetical protein
MDKIKRRQSVNCFEPFVKWKREGRRIGGSRVEDLRAALPPLIRSSVSRFSLRTATSFAAAGLLGDSTQSPVAPERPLLCPR